MHIHRAVILQTSLYLDEVPKDFCCQLYCSIMPRGGKWVRIYGEIYTISFGGMDAHCLAVFFELI